MSHLQYYILHCPAQCCGAGAGAVAGAGQSRYFWSELEPMKRQEGKKRVLLLFSLLLSKEEPEPELKKSIWGQSRSW